MSEDTTLSTMDEILEDLTKVYDDLVETSDELAKAMGLDPDRVLSHVMPRNKETRRNTQRIKTWFEDSREAAEKRMEKVTRANAKEALLAKLNLTEEEKALLLG